MHTGRQLRLSRGFVPPLKKRRAATADDDGDDFTFDDDVLPPVSVATGAVRPARRYRY